MCPLVSQFPLKKSENNILYNLTSIYGVSVGIQILPHIDEGSMNTCLLNNLLNVVLIAVFENV